MVAEISEVFCADVAPYVRNDPAAPLDPGFVVEVSRKCVPADNAGICTAIVELADGKIVVVFDPLRSWMVLVCEYIFVIAIATIIPMVTIILFNAYL